MGCASYDIRCANIKNQSIIYNSDSNKQSIYFFKTRGYFSVKSRPASVQGVVPIITAGASTSRISPSHTTVTSRESPNQSISDSKNSSAPAISPFRGTVTPRESPNESVTDTKQLSTVIAGVMKHIKTVLHNAVIMSEIIHKCLQATLYVHQLLVNYQQPIPVRTRSSPAYVQFALKQYQSAFWRNMQMLVLMLHLCFDFVSCKSTVFL